MSAAPRPFPVYPKKGLKYGGGARIKIAGKQFYLGKHGSPESFREYERLRLEHAKGGTVQKLRELTNTLTIEQLVAEYLRNEPRGVTNKEVQRVARACTPMLRLYGTTAAEDFRTNRLRAVQEAMIDGSWRNEDDKLRGKLWRRKYINKSIERIIRVFKWAESRELIVMGTTEHLKTLSPLKLTDKRVKNSPPREPCDWETQVKPCLPFMSPVIRAMVQVQYWAGMRPSEICAMRRFEIDQNGPDGVWLYRPTFHKSEWRGHSLVKALGPKSQEVLAPWLMAAEPEGYIFPPEKRRNAAPRYLENGYAQAIRRAVKLAGVVSWYPYQLRHAAGHAAELAGGLTGAAAFLGHHSLETTKTYTDKVRLNIAIEMAKKIG